MSAHEFSFPALSGGELPLSQYRGKAVLVVNTASECGFTPQYAGLQKLWQDYRDRGLVVLGVPSNDFGEQEPGEAGEIAAFCEKNYGVDFPLAAKQRVIGGDAHPFYLWVGELIGEDALPKWNFHKYLLDTDGELIGAWPSKVTPEDEELRRAIEVALSG
ncbi:MAG TPA: glutathione peroxidase [Alphaproteobacteria bacterium]|jgi:glutathione peroxidase|nr:glutathione peroxidase [Alphaproteobacteria bacterium]